MARLRWGREVGGNLGPASAPWCGGGNAGDVRWGKRRVAFLASASPWVDQVVGMLMHVACQTVRACAVIAASDDWAVGYRMRGEDGAALLAVRGCKNGCKKFRLRANAGASARAALLILRLIKCGAPTPFLIFAGDGVGAAPKTRAISP